jgi:hypothetical protein
MPELPDLTVYLERLQARVLGRRLRWIVLLNPFLLRTATPPIESAESRTSWDRRLGEGGLARTAGPPQVAERCRQLDPTGEQHFRTVPGATRRLARPENEEDSFQEPHVRRAELAPRPLHCHDWHNAHLAKRLIRGA